jgi:broad specificity phosphatase PhoE
MIHQILTYDSQLSSIGVHNSKLAKEKINKINEINEIDLIGSSSLLRAIETAYLMFSEYLVNDNKIMILPYIKENTKYPFDIATNKPSSINDQKTFLKNNNYNINKIDYSYVYSNDIGRITQNYNNFIEDTLPKLIYDIKKKNPDKKDIKMIIVTHSLLMKNILRCVDDKNNKPNNNDIYKVKYTINNNILKQTNEKCSIIYKHVPEYNDQISDNKCNIYSNTLILSYFISLLLIIIGILTIVNYRKQIKTKIYNDV